MRNTTKHDATVFLLLRGEDLQTFGGLPRTSVDALDLGALVLDATTPRATV
ncbi:MAG: hypothetical protein AAGI52_07025 [Bacteroidota bacterium]